MGPIRRIRVRDQCEDDRSGVGYRDRRSTSPDRLTGRRPERVTQPLGRRGSGRLARSVDLVRGPLSPRPAGPLRRRSGALQPSEATKARLRPESSGSAALPRWMRNSMVNHSAVAGSSSDELASSFHGRKSREEEWTEERLGRHYFERPVSSEQSHDAMHSGEG